MTVIDLQCIDDIIDDVTRTVTSWLNEEVSGILPDQTRATIRKKVDAIIEDAYYSCIIEQEDDEDEDEDEEDEEVEKDWFERIWYCGEEGLVEFDGSDFDSKALIDEILTCITRESDNCSAISQEMKESLVKKIHMAIGEGSEQIDRADELDSYA